MPAEEEPRHREENRRAKPAPSVRVMIDACLDRILGQRTGERLLVAIVGPPGSGKSTLADALCAELARHGASSAVLPMDGFHYDDAILKARGLMARKGSPETFDIGGLGALLGRLAQNDAPEIAVPVFDRALEIARNAARIIPRQTEIVLVEGNYLLLDRPGWRDLSRHFGLTIALREAPDVLRARLMRRWRALGLPEGDAAAKVDANDMPNGLTVLQESRPAQITLGGTPSLARGRDARAAT